MVTIERDLDAVRMAQALAIRCQVFTDEQGIPAALEVDGCDSEAEHVLVLVDDQPAATGRLLAVTRREGVLARIAVLPRFRRQGLGRRVVAALEVLARRQGLTEVSLKPHEHLERFYASLGYERVGGVEVVGGHPLITMCKPLPKVSRRR